MFLNVAEYLKEQDDIVFLLIGDGNQKTIILEEIQSRQINNIKYFPWQPLEIIADVYNACDIGFIPLKQGVIGNGIPSKACQLMAAKRVVINSVEESAYTQLFEKYHMGINVTNNSSEAVANAIMRLRDNPKEYQLIGENAYHYAHKHYSRSNNTKKFVDLIIDTVNSQ